MDATIGARQNDSDRHRPVVGSVFDERYQILNKLGSGSYGKVFLARDLRGNSAAIALKVLQFTGSDDTSELKRFQNEVRLLRQLNHPNLIRTYEYKQTQFGVHYLTMEYVEGISLEERLEAGPLPVTETLRILTEVARAVGHAHRHNIVHRDLKPGNILLSRRGQIKLTDFGFARALNENQGLTLTGETLGTPFYMAPEQFAGSFPTPAADVYSLGIIGYECLCGSRPFDGKTYLELAYQHRSDDIPSLAEMKLGVPCWIDGLIAKAAAKDPEARFKNGEVFALEVQNQLKIQAEEHGVLDRIVLFFRPQGTLCTFLASRGFPREAALKCIGAMLLLGAALLLSRLLMRFL